MTVRVSDTIVKI